MSKNIFKNAKTETIFSLEARNFVVQVDDKFYNKNGVYTFSKEKAISHYNKIINEILEMIYESDQKQVKRGLELLLNTRILPLRIH